MTRVWNRRSTDRQLVEALTAVTHEAVLRIRTMAFKRESMLDRYFPGTDYQEQIRLLADMCDTLVPGIASGSRRALEWACETHPQQRAWMTAVLAERGIDLDRLAGS